MKLLIDIPKEFEQHFQTDKFEDSLHRLSADAHLLAGLYEQETALMLTEAFKNAVSVSPHGGLKVVKTLTQNVLDKIRAEFINQYPKNYMGEPELNGARCVFSLNNVLDVIDKYRIESEEI